ncbi:MAG: U32 family peptidase [Bacteroidales bacterium]|nr:U32 family peptidase [Bacteroidales bacterium]
MQLNLELLAPARNADIGIAAIDCGADAVYIAGPAFGARAAAGNPVDDIARLCRHAHLYGAKVHATVNTLLEDTEFVQARQLMQDLCEAGVDVFIIQDLRLLEGPLTPVELHASTQTAIRTPERARELEALGFSRLVLERQLTLEQIRAIRDAVSCELECFIHGAICVGYSGQCYLSQQLTGRSANRGVCAQACRSRYDLVDADGRVIVRDQPLLSPRDLRLDAQLPDLVAAGVTSFKIEGRLKNASYVKNVVRHYRGVIDDFLAEHPAYAAASAGRLEGGFTPDPDRTFTRGWTAALLRGEREKMRSEDAAKALGEYIGEIVSVRGRSVEISGGKPLANGDGLSFVGKGDAVTGARVELAEGRRVTLRDASGLTPGMRVYRNLDIRFERELEKNMPRRVLDVALDWHSQGGQTVVSASSQGISVERRFSDDAPLAEKPDVALEGLRRQMGKHTGPFAFALRNVTAEPVRFYPAAFLNQIRRDLAAELQAQLEARPRTATAHTPRPGAGALNRSTLGIPAELLRSRYCIRWELGLCPRCRVKPGMTKEAKFDKRDVGALPQTPPLYLVNQKNRLRLHFDCAACEMVITPDC